MDGNTVFTNKPPEAGSNQNSTPPPPVPPVQPVAPVAPEAPKMAPQPIAEMPKAASVVPQQLSPVPAAPPPGLPPTAPLGGIPENVPSAKFSLGKILKVLGLILGVVAIGFLIFGVIIPFLNKDKATEVQLTYWGLWENESVMKSVIADFEKANPKIKVKYEKRDIKQYRETVTTRIQNGNGPDIYAYHSTWYPMFSNLLAPLSNDVIKKDDFKAQYFPVVQNDVVKNGAIYGLPEGVDTLALFINKDIFAAAGLDTPTTWDTFSSVSRKLTVKDEEGKIKTAGAAIGTFDNINNAPDIASLLFAQNGADIKNLSSTAKNSTDALAFYTSFAKGDASVWDDTLDPSLLMFTKGSLAMYFGYSYDVFAIRASNPGLPFEVHEVPHVPGRDTTIASYWVDGVSIKSQHQKEAMLFMKFLAQKETQQKIFSAASKTRLFGQLYARKDLADTLKDNEYAYPFVSQAKDASSSFFAANTYDNGLNSQTNAYLGNAIRSILNNTSPETALETLSAGVSQVLSRYGL